MVLTLSGLAVGTIKDIGLVTYQGQNMVEFHLQIQSRFQARITTSSKALVKSIGVLGDKYMEITLGKNGETPLKPTAPSSPPSPRSTGKRWRRTFPARCRTC